MPTVLLLALLAALSLASSASATHVLLAHVSLGEGGTGNALNRPASFAATSTDGSRVFFDTTESLVPGDTDSAVDLYQRSGGVTTLISTGSTSSCALPACDALFAGASADGTHVFFHTREGLVGGDTDGRFDVYERFSGATSLVSAGGNSPSHDAFLRGNSTDGSRAFFETTESLVGAADPDTRTDVYQRSGGITTLVSTGTTSGGAFNSRFRGASNDGTRVFFETDEKLESPDSDARADVYERFSNATTLVSTGPAGGNGDLPANFDAISGDGSRVIFHTEESLTSADTDTVQRDIYQRSAGVTTLLSIGSTGGNGPLPVTFVYATPDATHVYFETFETLTGADTDNKLDGYDRSAGSATLVTTNATGSSGADAFVAKASDDGSRVFFETVQALTGADTDSVNDVYERFGGATALLSTGPTGGNGAFGAVFKNASSDGVRVYFDTAESLVSLDDDAALDVYERVNGSTQVLSVGAAGGNGSVPASYRGQTPDGHSVFVETTEVLLPSDADNGNDVYVNTALAGYARPQAGVQFRVPLVIAYAECGDNETPNRFHGGGLTGGSCNPATPTSSYLTVGTQDANTFNPLSVGFVKLTACIAGTTGSGACSTPSGMISPDVRMEVQTNDIRCKAGVSTCEGGVNSDYTGELRVSISVRGTDDHNNVTPGQTGDPATATDGVPLPMDLTCAANGSGGSPTAIGGTCSVLTRASAVMPGAIVPAKRTNWETKRVEVSDGGSDGDTATAGNNLFEVQGVFVP